MTDYGFVPGREQVHGFLRNLFLRRASPVKLAPRKTATFHDFVEYLKSTATPPIDNLLTGAHGNSEGALQLPMFRGKDGSGTATYEVLDKTLATSQQSIDIPASVTQKSVHIRGCNIGRARPFLERMRTVMGGRVSITAPLHFDELVDSSRYGTWEFMCYEFVVNSRTAYAKREDLITAFQSKSFKLIDGTAVPPASWAQWIPANLRFKQTRPVLPFESTLPKKKTIPTNQEFRAKKSAFKWPVKYPKKTDIPSPSDRELAIRKSMREHATFAASHPYPMWSRLGYTDVDAFFAGYDWKYSVNKTVLIGSGTRMKYTVLVPITVNGNVVVNFNPLPGKGFPRLVQLDESNGLYFAKVP